MPTASSHAIDASRVLLKKHGEEAPDLSATDAVWVPVVGNSIEDVTSSQARNDVLQFVVERFGQGDAIDREEPPVPDDGAVLPAAVTAGSRPDSRMTMSADEYIQAAARKQMDPRRVSRYVAYYRVRRLGLV